ncbi:hypothetical protein ACIA5E_18115 [Nocardia asteroides]|uniref:hypothetical protein n=1 Tax=Nocardia asteroides TaxID=1824 RepID=UPI003796E5E7
MEYLREYLSSADLLALAARYANDVAVEPPAEVERLHATLQEIGAHEQAGVLAQRRDHAAALRPAEDGWLRFDLGGLAAHEAKAMNTEVGRAARHGRRAPRMPQAPMHRLLGSLSAHVPATDDTFSSDSALSALTQLRPPDPQWKQLVHQVMSDIALTAPVEVGILLRHLRAVGAGIELAAFVERITT